MSFNSNFENGIIIVGAGNVATHLSLALKNAGYSIRYIYSKTEESAKKLALKVGSDYSNDFNKIPDDADLYIISVKDEAVEKVISKIKIENGIIVHTAGSISINVFDKQFDQYGVFYPLQTFSKTRDIDFSNVPICVEANNKQVEVSLIELAKTLTKSVQLISSEKRMILHLSAVFACNFANHMYSVATEIIDQSGLPFELLKPLISETANKALESNPLTAQTGPAVRNDQNVIQKHLKMLKKYPEFEKIYKFTSESIYTLKGKKKK